MRYRGIIEEHVTMISKKAKTPGIEFRITLRQKQVGSDWLPIQWLERSMAVYFKSGGDHSWSLKKLAFAGHKGGSLADMNLTGNTVEVVSSFESYDGKEVEKFELALPPRGLSQRNDNAALAIDAILTAKPIDPVELPDAIDPDERPSADAPSGLDKAISGALAEEAPARSLDDDDVPF